MGLVFRALRVHQVVLEQQDLQEPLEHPGAWVLVGPLGQMVILVLMGKRALQGALGSQAP